MASITPLTSLPAAGSTPAGTVTISNLQGRLTAQLTNGGAATLRLITKTEGGNWAYVDDSLGNPRELVVTANQNFGDGNNTLTFDNAAVSTQYHVVLNGGSSAVSCWLSALTDPGTSTALVAHASTHLSGGSDDLLGSPGDVGDITPGTFSGTFGPDGTHQNTVPTVNGDTFALIAAAQTLTNKTLTAPIINGATSASGNFDLSGSSGTFKTSTGAVTIGGGSAAITLSTSAGAINETAGAASTYKTTAGALNVDGFAGVNLKVNTSLVADAGATSSSALTLAANKSLAAAAGSGGIDFSTATGDTKLGTGSIAYTAASGKTVTITSDGAASLTSASSSLTLTAAGASTWSTSSGALSISGKTGINLKYDGGTVADVGVTSSTALTLAANKSIVGAAGTGAVTFGSMTGDMTLPTGAVSWAGAANKNLSLVGSGTGTVTINNADAMNIGTSGTTTLTLGRSGQSTVLAGNVSFSAAIRASASAFLIADPGDAGAIAVTTSGVCAITTGGAGQTRTAAIPTFVGQRLTLVLDTDGGGDVAVTFASDIDQSGNNVWTAGDAGDTLELVGATIGGTRAWRLVANLGGALS